MMASAQQDPQRQPVPLEDVDRRAAVQGAFHIMRAWGVSNEQVRALLGAPAKRTFFAWQRGDVKRVPADVLRRIGYLAGIYKALQILYSDADSADTWVKRPNRAFGEQTPLQRMCAGDVTDLAAVRSYLDAARAPWS
jgi:hypothetical protein